jgi:hypothetical protein
MPTAFSQPELDQLEREIQALKPPEPSADDIDTAPAVLSITGASGNAFMLLTLVDVNGTKQTFLMSPSVALWLQALVLTGAQGVGWTDENGRPIMPGRKPATPEVSIAAKREWAVLFAKKLPPPPSMIELFKSPVIVSASAGSGMEGMVFCFRLRSGEMKDFYFNTVTATRLLALVQEAAQVGGWLGRDKKLQPKAAALH